MFLSASAYANVVREANRLRQQDGFEGEGFASEISLEEDLSELLEAPASHLSAASLWQVSGW